MSRKGTNDERERADKPVKVRNDCITINNWRERRHNAGQMLMFYSLKTSEVHCGM